jgi:hypothetical protein
MLNNLTAVDFSSVDFDNKPSFMHFNNVIPFVSSVLASSEEFNRTDAIIVSTVEGIIQRSGHLMNEYSRENEQYQPDWAKKVQSMDVQLFSVYCRHELRKHMDVTLQWCLRSTSLHHMHQRLTVTCALRYQLVEQL